MQLENKATKPELFEASEADKGNSEATKEVGFFPLTFPVSRPHWCLSLDAAGLPLSTLQRL